MKKILAIVMVAAMIAAMAVTTSAADISTDGLISHITFDNGLINEVTGEALVAHQSGSGSFGDPLWDVDEYEFYQNGVNGSYAYDMNTADGFEVGALENGSDFTVGLWLTLLGNSGINPYIWWGGKSQSPENWVGLWNVPVSKDGDAWDPHTGPCIASNGGSTSRLGFVPDYTGLYDDSAESGIVMPWTHVVLTGVYDADTNSYTGTIYLNGENVGSVSGLPNPNDKEGAIVYFNSINAWADPQANGFADDIVLYSRAMSDADVAELYGTYEVPTFADANALYDVPTNLESGDSAGDDGNGGDEGTEAPKDEGTEAPKDEGTTAAPAGDGTGATTEAPKDDEKGGCGSTLGAAAAIVALTGVFGCAIVKKH